MHFDEIINYLIQNKITISIMESCTSGLVAPIITNIIGASSIFQGVVVFYSNKVKVKVLHGVPQETIGTYY